MDSTWRDAAACRGMDTELFFASGSTGVALDRTERAKAVCRGCPVVAVCLEWALVTGQHDGVWGGKSEDERHQLRRRRKLAQQARKERSRRDSLATVNAAPGGTR